MILITAPDMMNCAEPPPDRGRLHPSRRGSNSSAGIHTRAAREFSRSEADSGLSTPKVAAARVTRRKELYGNQAAASPSPERRLAAALASEESAKAPKEMHIQLGVPFSTAGCSWGPAACPSPRQTLGALVSLRKCVAWKRGDTRNFVHNASTIGDTRNPSPHPTVRTAAPGDPLCAHGQRHDLANRHSVAIHPPKRLPSQTVRNVRPDLAHSCCLSKVKDATGRTTRSPNCAAPGTCGTLCVTRYADPASRVECTMRSWSWHAPAGSHSAAGLLRFTSAQRAPRISQQACYAAVAASPGASDGSYAHQGRALSREAVHPVADSDSPLRPSWRPLVTGERP